MHKHLSRAVLITLMVMTLAPFTSLADYDPSCYICLTQGSGCLMHGSDWDSNDSSGSSDSSDSNDDDRISSGDVIREWINSAHRFASPIITTVQYYVQEVTSDGAIGGYGIRPPTPAELWFTGF